MEKCATLPFASPLHNPVQQQSSVIDVLLKQLAYSLLLVYGSEGTVLYSAAECELMQCSV
jgi:hypothetical protein